MNIKKHPFIFTFNILIFLFAVLFHYTVAYSLSIKGITPLLILPILTAFSLYHSPLVSALTGLFAGIFMDACMIGSHCFNALVLMFVGVFVSVSSNILFNKNIRSATVLSLITASVYFILQWIIFYTSNVTVDDKLIYLLKYALPSIIFTAIFIFPFYFLYRYFNNSEIK